MGNRLHGAGDLVRILAGKRMLFVGDSVTDQVVQALDCALRRADLGPQELISARWRTPQLQHACMRLGRAVARGMARNDCVCAIKEADSWLNTNCQLLWSQQEKSYADGFPGTAAKMNVLPLSDSVATMGTRWLRYNFTLFRRFGDYLLGSRRHCQLCTAAHVADTALRVPPGPQQCGKTDFCATHPLPSQLELLLEDGAADVDVVVFNLGLHYHFEDDFVNATTQALLELEAFGAREGKVAIFRETSAQHFPVSSGDYDDAKALNPALLAGQNVTALADRSREPHGAPGPSLCFPRGKGPPIGPIINDVTGPASRKAMTLGGVSGRNHRLHRLHRELGLRHVVIQPFEELTVDRWDYHTSLVFNQAMKRWWSDCTHFCYSPAFWVRDCVRLWASTAMLSPCSL